MLSAAYSATMGLHARSISKEFHLDLRALLSGASTASDQTNSAGNETVSREREAALVEDARQDPAAFAYLYELYFARVYRYLRMRVEHESDAEDLTQQVFLQALNALPRYQTRGAPFAAWLFTIARRALADHGQRARSHPSPIALDAAPEMADELDMERNLLQREAYERLARLLATRDPAERDLLALRFAGGLNASEIAAIFGKRPDAVRKQLSRLLHTLKEQYDVTR
jgi:RNA polymerase sigma-70 factor (ECF subfamily)